MRSSQSSSSSLIFLRFLAFYRCFIGDLTVDSLLSLLFSCSFCIFSTQTSLFHYLLHLWFIMPPRQNPQILQQNQVNIDSIFYVHLSDGPNSVTVTTLLTCSNYLAWSRSMQRALGVKTSSSSSMDPYMFLILMIWIATHGNVAIISCILVYSTMYLLKLRKSTFLNISKELVHLHECFYFIFTHVCKNNKIWKYNWRIMWDQINSYVVTKKKTIMLIFLVKVQSDKYKIYNL